jgi:hypothetical protein|eukprot:COSAG02_NODE_6682_length_3421_cov_2.125828_8_plen_76_part_00
MIETDSAAACQYGEPADALDIPPARQVATPFGTNIGPTNPAFWPIMPESQVRTRHTWPLPLATLGTDRSRGADSA